MPDRAPLLAVVDTETLGLDPDKHALWEIGLILADPVTCRSYLETSWQLEVTDEQIAAAEPEALAVNGFNDRYGLTEIPCSPAEVMQQFVDLTRGCHIMGNVVSFDEERIRRLALSHGIEPGWHYHLIDVESMVIGYLHHKRWVSSVDAETVALLDNWPWKSTALSLAIGVDPAQFDRHTALGDAKWALAEYAKITGQDGS